jgi:hypothetical protein
MTSRLTVARLKANILRPALTSHYSVEISPPPAASSFIQQNAGLRWDTEFLMITCCEASLPGSSIATLDVMNDYVGVSEKHGYRRLYDDRADFTFYVDTNYAPIRLFESWMKYINGEEYAKGIDKRTFTSRVTWPNDYCTDQLYITKYERDYNTFLKYRFIKAFPVSINSIPVSYDASNLLKVTVSFVYSRYYVDNFRVDQSTSSLPQQTADSPLANPNKTRSSSGTLDYLDRAFGFDASGQSFLDSFNSKFPR